MQTCMTALETLISYIFQHPDDMQLRGDWLELLRYYNPVIEQLQKPMEFTKDDIEDFQNQIDLFYEKWIHMVG